MPANAEKSSTETFIVWNDYINLIGAIVPSGEGKVSLRGTIRFKNGESLSFSCKQENPEVLQQKLTTVCRQIAKFYRTNLIRRKDNNTGSVNESSVVLNNLTPLLN
jgi:hypothetical protein